MSILDRPLASASSYIKRFLFFITGTRAVSKAFVNTLRQEYAVTAVSKAGGGKQGVKHAAANTKTGFITLNEAMDILHISDLDPVEANKRFEHLYQINSKSKGGSLYIQSKVFRAKERIDYELKIKPKVEW